MHFMVGLFLFDIELSQAFSIGGSYFMQFQIQVFVIQHLQFEGDVKVYQGLFYSQDPSPILGVQVKHITCIILMLTLLNVWLV